MAKQTKALVKAEKAPMKNSRRVMPESTDSLISLVIKKNGTIDIALLKELTALKHAEEDRFAQQQFDVNFALAQARFPCVKKTKIARNDEGKKLYAFCPIEDILPVYGPILTGNGFTWRWDEVPVDDKHKKVVCSLSGYGHTKTANMIIPIVKGTRANNEIQESAIATSYGHRYTFNSVVGVIIAGEDTDAQMKREPMKEPQAKQTPEEAELLTARANLNKLYGLIKRSGLFAEQGEGSFYLDNMLTDATLDKDDVSKLKMYYKIWEKEFNTRKGVKA